MLSGEEVFFFRAQSEISTKRSLLDTLTLRISLHLEKQHLGAVMDLKKGWPGTKLYGGGGAGITGSKNPKYFLRLYDEVIINLLFE